MNLQRYLDDYGRRAILKIVRDELAKRDYDKDYERYDPGDDEETFEDLLLYLFPPDGKDGQKKEHKP